jgi:transcriptional regulator with XRE-family HTH domain
MTDTEHLRPLTIGEAIAVLRKRCGLSQTQLAEKAGVSRNEVSLLECDKTDYRLGTLRAVGAALGMRLEVSLITKDGKEAKQP